MHLDPLQLQQSLAAILSRIDRDPGLRAELARARREFFGADEPDYVGDGDGLEAAAIRFAEWFVLERQSDLLGATPLAALASEPAGGATDVPLMFHDTVVGVFIVESAVDGETRVRDLDDGGRLTLSKVPDELRPGDLVIGRLYPAPDGTLVPSSVATVLRSAPQLAVAFQKDLRSLGLARRLTQAELEQLMFRQLHQMAGSVPEVQGSAPLERLEAELQLLLEDCARDDEYPITLISEALRDSPQPGPVVVPLLDELAFHTDVDLDRTRRVLVEIWNAHHAAPAPAPQQTGKAPAPRPRRAARPARKGRKFVPRDGESLGQQLARRIEEGLANGEAVADVFEHVEHLLGESLGDDAAVEPAGVDATGDRSAGVGVDADATAIDADYEAGDVAPLVREFAWETGLDADGQRRLDEFVAALAEVPVPRFWLESIEVEDVLRFLLRLWLCSAPERRLDEVRSTFDTLERFFRWLAEAQHIDRPQLLESCRTAFVSSTGRLQSASLALTSADAVEPDRVRLMRVVLLDGEELRVVMTDGGAVERRVSIPDGSAAHLREGDCLLGALNGAVSEPGRLVGMVIAVPADAEPLLG